MVHQIGKLVLQCYSLLCSVNDAVNVLPCSTCSYLNGWLSQPALPFQEDAKFPAATRLRIWRLRRPLVPVIPSGNTLRVNRPPVGLAAEPFRESRLELFRLGSPASVILVRLWSD